MGDGTAPRVRIMLQAWIQACPFYIFDMDHYREDGTCRCDDPLEQNRKSGWLAPMVNKVSQFG